MLFGDSPPPGLVGIAKLASQSEILEAKRAVQYFEIETRSLLNRTRPGMPFGWSINPYRGCEFGCRYCYARYTHEFMELRESHQFEDQIYAKCHVAEILRKELKRVNKTGWITIGTATDPYQPAERRYGRTRAILEVFAAQRGFSVAIITKSDLIARDTALLAGIGQHNRVAIHMTITTLDRDLARLLEPRAPRPDLRLKAVQTLAAAGLSVGVFPSPIMPGINDDERKLDRLAKEARDHGATHFGGGILFLMPCARKVFFPFVERHYPHLLRRYEERYAKNAYVKGPYADMIKQRIAAVRDRYGLISSPRERGIAAMDGASEENAASEETAQGELFKT